MQALDGIGGVDDSAHRGRAGEERGDGFSVKASGSIPDRCCPRADYLGCFLWLLSPCGQVHAFGLREALDVVYLDGSDCVVKCVAGLGPNRLSGSWRGRELCSNLVYA